MIKPFILSSIFLSATLPFFVSTSAVYATEKHPFSQAATDHADHSEKKPAPFYAGPCEPDSAPGNYQSNWRLQDYDAMASNMKDYAAEITAFFDYTDSLETVAEKLKSRYPGSTVETDTTKQTVTAIYRNDEGAFHREDGPAFIKINLKNKSFAEMWARNEEIHREGDPAWTKVMEDSISQEWYQNNKIHNTERPARVRLDLKNNSLDIGWHIDGFRDRINGSPTDIKIDLATDVVFSEQYSSGGGVERHVMHREDDLEFVFRDRQTGKAVDTLWYFHDNDHEETHSDEYKHIMKCSPNGGVLTDVWTKNDIEFEAPENFIPPVGNSIVEKAPQPQHQSHNHHHANADPVDIVKNPVDIPEPINRRDPETVRVELEAREVNGHLDDGTTYHYWTFNGTVPGPLLRVRAGDTVEVSFTNADDSGEEHSVDFHAVTGPHGGGHATITSPGDHTGFTFKAMKPGLYIYHCATPMVSQHIANGMYGMILVEPEEGLEPVDHEFYVMQGEIYTKEDLGTRGLLTESKDKLMNETPEYYVFNGAVGALTETKPMEIKTGETVRIYFGVGGPNKTSSFHVIGEIFDKVYDFGSFSNAPLEDVQTITVPPGGAGIVEFKVEVPGTYVLVDHALTRIERGLTGHLKATGAPQPEIFNNQTPVAP